MTRRPAPVLSILRSVSIAACAWAVLGAMPAAALAQPAHIPCETAGSQRLSDSDKSRIAEFAAEGVALLNSGDSAQIQRGREQLMTPLRCPDVSAAFRIEYGRALDAGLRSAIGSDNDQAAANALLVTGMVASTGALQSIERGLSSDREPIRAAAAAALQSTLREQALGRVRLTGAVLENTLARAGQQLGKETSPVVVEAMIVALRAPAAAEEGVAVPALRALGQGVADAFAGVRERDGTDHTGWAHAAERATSTLWRTTFDSQSRALNESQAKAGALASAQIIAYARDRAADEADPMSDDERAALGRAVESAEAALILINSRLTGTPAVEKGLAEAFTRGNGFATEADKWIGDAGRLTKAPYSFDADALAPN